MNNIHKKISPLYLIALCLPVTMACIDVMAISVALHPIMQEFNIPYTSAQWLLSLYTVCNAAFLITAGQLADTYGRHRLLLIGIFLFTLASLLAAYSESILGLIICRTVQGLAGAILTTTVIAIITHDFAPDERGSIIAKWSFSLGLGLATGPIVGGTLIHYFGWRAIFFINLPIGIISYFLAYYFVSASKHAASAKLKISWLETIILATVLTSLMLVLSQSSTWGWATPITTIFLGIFFISSILFFYLEKKLPIPLIDITLFKEPNFLNAVGCGFVSYFCLYAWLFIINIYLQQAFALSTYEAGLMCLPFSIAFAFSSFLTGKFINKLSNKTATQVGLVSCLTALLLMLTINHQTNLIQLGGMFFLFGISIANINIASMKVATEKVPSNKTGIASGLIFTIRWLGGTLGITIISALFQSVYKRNTINPLINSHYTDALNLSLLASCLALAILTFVCLIIVSFTIKSTKPALP